MNLHWPQTVIASESEEIIASANGSVDCSVASLVAMTASKYNLAFPRRDAPEFC
jgi:hypothetical protein